MTAKKLSLFLVLVILSALLTGCGCEHEWQDSTCLAPKICIHCGEMQGKVRSHDWESTACHDPKPCTVCGTMEGMELTHEWGPDSKICIHCGHDGRPADDRFMDALTEGINSRWSLHMYEDKSLTKEEWKNCIRTEYDLLIPFQEEKFQDKDLGDAAKEYVRCVSESMEAVESYDPETWFDIYDSQIFQEQCVALHHINQIRPVTAAEDHAPRLAYTLSQGEIVDMIFPIFDDILFLYVDGTEYSKKYETTLTNNTSLNFRKFTFEVDLYDEEGNVIDTVEASANYWGPGDRKRFNFNTKVEFSSMKVRFANWKF